MYGATNLQFIIIGRVARHSRDRITNTREKVILGDGTRTVQTMARLAGTDIGYPNGDGSQIFLCIRGPMSGILLTIRAIYKDLQDEFNRREGRADCFRLMRHPEVHRPILGFWISYGDRTAHGDNRRGILLKRTARTRSPLRDLN